MLGGVRIDHPRGLAGHSDGDVRAHALIDALLGAAGLGDIGSLFPSGDERFRGADSLDLLRDELVAVQTPQAFVAPVLRAALGRGEGSDCASLVEAHGGRITVVEGDERLLKVTTRADLERVAAWL